MKQGSERRQFWRSVFQSPVRYSMGAVSHAARLLDVSLKGALLEMVLPWSGRVGQSGVLQLELGEGVGITMYTSVAYVHGSHVGLHCDSIDLDSITHLRRLVELNSGDPDILDRDLANLLAEGH